MLAGEATLGEQLVLLAHIVLLWDMEDSNSYSMSTSPKAMVGKCLQLDLDLCEEQLSCTVIATRWKPTCWQFWWWEGDARERPVVVHVSSSEMRVPLSWRVHAPVRPWKQEESFSISWSPEPALFLSQTSDIKALNISFREFSIMF